MSADLIFLLEGRLRSSVRCLNVSIVGEQLTLEGCCRLYYHKQVAQEEAKKLFPGKQVINHIKVTT